MRQNKIISLWQRILCFVGLTGIMALVACTPIKKAYLRKDYAKVDRFKVKRLKVTVAPLPSERKDLGKLWTAVISNHINQKKNYIVKATVAKAEAGSLKTHCQAGVEGWLHFLPKVTQVGDKVKIKVVARLKRCRDGQEVWNVTAKGKWKSDDEHLKELTKDYTKKFGKGVTPFVAPSCRILFVVIEKLPNPKLTEADVLEKIQNS